MNKQIKLKCIDSDSDNNDDIAHVSNTKILKYFKL